MSKGILLKLGVIVIVLLAISVAAGCGSGSPATPIPATPVPATTVPTKAAAPATPKPEQSTAKAATPKPTPSWQDEMTRLQADAPKEGSLVLNSSAGAAVRDTLTKMMKEKYNLNLEWVSGRLGELLQKALAEQRAGINNMDVYLSGASGLFDLKAMGAEDTFVPLDKYLFLPEVLDKKAWWGGDLIFLDNEHRWVAVLAFPQPYIFINTDMVKPGEVKGWKDLLDPKWKGKMVLYNPRDGAGLDWAYSVGEVVMGRDYLYQFVKQEPIILSDSRQQTEWVARGKNPIAVAARTENMNEFINLKAPVKIISPEEGVHLISSAGGLSIFKNAPHQDSAKLFVNWTLTKEGGTVLSKLIGGQSAREDVPTDFLDPTMVRQPGGKYFNTITGDQYAKKSAFAKTAMEIFAPLMK